jgi:hypothetical protein
VNQRSLSFAHAKKSIAFHMCSTRLKGDSPAILDHRVNLRILFDITTGRFEFILSITLTYDAVRVEGCVVRR